MATRSHTNVFILMRNNALQNRHILCEQTADDTAALVPLHDVEKGLVVDRNDSLMPPPWIDKVEEVQYEMTKIRQKMKDLAVLHEKHMTRPTLDDSHADERNMEMLTHDITRMFGHCQRLIHYIKSQGKASTPQEAKVTRNIVSSLVSSLQELSTAFRVSQSTYVRTLSMREQRSQEFLDTPLLLPSGDNMFASDFESVSSQDLKFSQQQLLLLEDNTQMVENREKEINQIVQSIAELNDIFKDLATMVVDQGTVLDRIDYNIENVQTKVGQGLQQLHKAENYQRKNRKMICILGLSGTIIILIILLIITKS